jgi:hypothetical protein
MTGEYKPGDRVEKEDEWLVFPGDMVGYTIDYSSDDGIIFEKIIVWEDQKLRDRIVELLNKYGERDA